MPKKKDCSLKTVLRALRALQVPTTGTRKNVMPDGVGVIHGFLLGLYNYGGNTGMAGGTLRPPLLLWLLIQALRKEAPDFPFTSIQINYGYAFRPHVDKNNLGTSYIVGVGDYTDGELWVDDDTGDVPYVLEGKKNVSGYYRIGRELRGTELQIKDTWTIFDGNMMQLTKAFQGERYSLIFFTSDRYSAASPSVREALQDAGFDFDFNNEDMQSVLRAKHARRADLQRQVAPERREIERQRMLVRGRCIGRVWADACGFRCTAACQENSEFCGRHLREVKGQARWMTHGRMDGLLPKAKHAEMKMWQQRNLKNGKYPPCIEGATILVELTKEQKAVMQSTAPSRTSTGTDGGAQKDAEKL